MGEPILIGGVRFLNAWPLLCGLEDEAGVALRREVPSALAPLLRAGQVDVALLPAIEYFRLSVDPRERARPGAAARSAPTGFVALPVAAITSHGPVGSVRLFGYTEVERVRRVLLDPASETSNAVVRLLFARRYGLRPHFVLPEEPAAEALSPPRERRVSPAGGGARLAAGEEGQSPFSPTTAKKGTVPEPAARPPDAELVVGDRGLLAERPGAAWQLDLGAEWNEWTRRPLVYAFWVARSDAPLARIAQVLAAARDRGLAAREELAARAQAESGIPLDLARRHLLEQVQYAFGPAEQRGLRTFYEMASDEGLAPEGGRLELVPGAA